jgi:hypothetical protein
LQLDVDVVDAGLIEGVAALVVLFEGNQAKLKISTCSDTMRQSSGTTVALPIQDQC